MSTQTPDVPEVVDEPAAGRLDQIRNLRKQLQGKTHLTLLVPGYAGLVAVRYKSLPRQELDAWNAKLADQQPTINDNMDLLIRCCEAVLVRQTTSSRNPDGTPAWEPIDLDQAEPTTFSTGNLARCLGEEAHSAREEVAALFSPGGAQPLAPEAHAEPLINWQGDTDHRVDHALLGE